MTPQEADILRWMDLRGVPVTDTALLRQFPRLWPGSTLALLQRLWVEKDRRHYRLTSQGRRALSAFETAGSYIPFSGREEI